LVTETGMEYRSRTLCWAERREAKGGERSVYLLRVLIIWGNVGNLENFKEGLYV
jgi:hypothetical protein